MASDFRRRAFVRVTSIAALALACGLPASAAPEPTAARSSFSCDLKGKKLVSDRPIPECASVEQRELNTDGSLKRILQPTPTDDERAEIESKKLKDEAERVARNDAVRRDRNLMQRFPDEAAHGKARAKALDDFRASVRNYEARIALLLVERKRLEDEKAFYVNDRVNKPLPALLKQKLDANDAGLEAQRVLVQNQQTEIVRINASYDAELGRLKKLWAGAPAGSLGPLPGTPAAATTPESSTALVRTKAK